MKKIDIYILKKVFTVLPVLLVSLLGLICLITYIIDIFVIGNSYLQNVGFFNVMYFYLINTLATFNIIISALSFISIALITMRLCDRNEIIACFSLGISYTRFLKAFFISAVFFMKIMLVFEGWVMPKINRIREELDYKYFGTSARSYGSNIHVKLGVNKYMYIEYFSKYSDSGTNVFIDTIVNGKLMSRFSAKSMSWNNDREVWVFKKWKRVDFGKFKDIINSGDIIELSNINVYPTDLVFDENFQTKLMVDELNAITDRLSKRGLNNKLFRIEQVKRATRPIMLFLTVLVGVLFFSRKRREGNQLSMFLGFIVSFSIIVSSIVAEDIAIYSNKDIYVIFFLPIIFFCTLLYFVFKRYK